MSVQGREDRERHRAFKVGYTLGLEISTDHLLLELFSGESRRSFRL